MGVSPSAVGTLILNDANVGVVVRRDVQRKNTDATLCEKIDTDNWVCLLV